MPDSPEPLRLRAVLFDLDGVLIDSHEQHERAWEIWAGELGRALPEGFFKRGFGMRNETIIPDLLGWSRDPAEIARLSFRKEELYRSEIRERGLSPLPGVVDLLEQLHALGIPRAVASSTPRENLDVVMTMTGLGPWFQAIVTGSDVSHGKPHPEVFLKAAAALAADPENCVVIEDAFVGIDAGLAAGCRVLGVGTTHPCEALVKAHRAVPDLTAVSAADLMAMFG
jgi:HAD superfamily hydrolase (TIGR01509 family)